MRVRYSLRVHRPRDQVLEHVAKLGDVVTFTEQGTLQCSRRRDRRWWGKDAVRWHAGELSLDAGEEPASASFELIERWEAAGREIGHALRGEHRTLLQRHWRVVNPFAHAPALALASHT